MTQSIAVLILFIIAKQSSTSFPKHDAQDDLMVNPTFDPRDNPACGLFKQPPTAASGRVFNGEESYIGQFPWTVCMSRPGGPHIVKEYTTRSYTRLETFPNESIFDMGPYPFSGRKAEVHIEKVLGWLQMCSGSIIDEHWILSAAHCTEYTWEGMYFYVNAGTIKCFEVVDEDHLKLVVATRNDPKFKTIFEHPKYLTGKGEDARYDVSLIRINDGFSLPIDTYNNEAINRICIYSSADFPKKSCLRNVYFSGFGMKKDPNEEDIEYLNANLTWFTAARMVDSFCKIHILMDDEDRDEVDCFSSVPNHAFLKYNSSKTDAAISDKTEAGNYPNTCPGDSGGPFMYYMKFNGSGLESVYRALQINVLHGTGMRKDIKPRCEEQYYPGKGQLFGKFYHPFKSVFYRTVEVAATVSIRISNNWFNDALNYSNEGQIRIKGEFRKFLQYNRG